MAEDDPWVSATDLADYEFCPRSHWYHDHPPSGGPTREARVRSEAGSRYHERVLGAERRRDEHGGADWVALALGVLLTAGGMVWILYR
jgi:hypothetical protein